MPDASTLATPLAWALAYASIGWHVFPLEPQQKRPLGKLVPRGMLDASLDPGTIRVWWRTVPDAGIGIALSPSGLVAVDVDPRNGGAETFEALQSDHGSLRSDVMAFTGGGGEHHVFAVPDGMRLRLPGTLGPGVDLKANGYIAVEPSIHPSGKQYGWEASSNPLQGAAPSPLPDWLRSLRVELKPSQPDPSDVPVDPARARDLREALYTLGADDRETWLQAGMALHSTGWGQAGYAMWCAWSQQSDKFDATVQRKTWESFTSRGDGITAAWVFARAAETGWVNPRARILEEAPAGDWTGDVPPEGQPAPEKAREPALQLLSLSQLRERHDAVTWTIKGIVPAESVGLIFGGSGTFKSFIALDMALHVAHGLPWLGRKTVEGPVLYLAAEGGTGLWRRIDAWHRARRLKWQDAPMYVIPVPVDLMRDAILVTDAALKTGITPVLAVIDTLSQTFMGEENSAAEVSGYLAEIGLMLRATWQAAIAVVHHSGHQATERPRGSSALRANVDWMFGVFRDNKEMLATLTCEKQKDGEPFSDASFALAALELGRDADGDPITSLVARHLTSAEEVHQVMEEEGKAGRVGKNQLLLRLLQNGMPETELRHAFYQECGGDNADSRRQAYHRAKAWAIKAGFFEVAEGVVITLKRN